MPISLVLTCLLLLSALPAWGDVYKCPDGKGGTRFQNSPCIEREEDPMIITGPRSAPIAPPPLPSEVPSRVLPADPHLLAFVDLLRRLDTAVRLRMSREDFRHLLFQTNLELERITVGPRIEDPVWQGLQGAYASYHGALMAWDLLAADAGKFSASWVHKGMAEIVHPYLQRAHDHLQRALDLIALEKRPEYGASR